jgi:biopolymer transport protein ExbD
MSRKKKDDKKAKFVKNTPEEVDAILPFMSLLLIIIPVLISNVAFFHFKAISISAPGVSQNQDDSPPPENKPDKSKNIMAQLKLDPKRIHLELIDESDGSTMKKFKESIGAEGSRRILEVLKKYKERYPKLETLLITSHSSIDYENVVTVFDELKQPFVVSQSDPEKQFKFNIVILPMAEEENLGEES